MAGTDSTKNEILGGPTIVLVGPQMGENVGSAARAMLNCGLTDLRLVRPREGWDSGDSFAMAVGASRGILEAARVFETVDGAVVDMDRVYAATARVRDMVLPMLTPRHAAGEMRHRVGAGQKVAILFGSERFGLHNEDVARADAVIRAPLNPAFSSLNLGQAVLLVAWEWFMTGNETANVTVPDQGEPPAGHQQMESFIAHLDQALEEGGFFPSPPMRPRIMRAIRNWVARTNPTNKEIRLLHGVLASLSASRLGKDRPYRQPGTKKPLKGGGE